MMNAILKKVLPKCNHLKITIYTNILLGIWPIIFENYPTLKALYNLYSKFTFTYYTIFIISAIIKFLLLVTDEVVIVGEVVTNMCITLLYSATIMRVYAIKSKKARRMIEEIIALEKKILKCGDDEIIEIYNFHANQSIFASKMFLVNIFIITMLYFIRPIFAENTVKYYKSTNITVIEKPLPLSAWLPIDDQKQYPQAYVWHIFNGILGASFVCYSDIFTFSLIIFPLGQLKILTHILINFEKYVQKIQQQLGFEWDEAAFTTLRECVLKHKEIIRYVKDFNNIMRNIMIMDFLQSSLQLASVVLQLLLSRQITLFSIAFSGEFALSMFIRLLVYYWFANEVIEHSSDLGLALVSSRWYEQPSKVKYMILMMLLRCNKLLFLEIGPFNIMSLRTFLMILKATYSYLTVIYRI